MPEIESLPEIRDVLARARIIAVLGRNKTRSSLTALGIIIGVAAVIAVMAIGEGAKKQIEGQFAAVGTNLLILQPGSSTSSGVRGGSGSSASLTWDDLQAMVGGGLLGIGVHAATRTADQFGWPVLIRPDIVAIAVAFSGAVGIVFGLYPARKASRLDPIQALRFE